VQGGAAYDEAAFFDGSESAASSQRGAAAPVVASPMPTLEKTGWQDPVPQGAGTPSSAPTKTGDAPTVTPQSAEPKPVVAAREATAEAPAPKEVVKTGAQAPVASAPAKKAETAAPVDSAAKPPAAGAALTTPGGPATAAASDLVAGDAKIEKQSDGSYIVDGKYTLKGTGTKASPYEVTWDYLVSAQESYQPRLGKKKLPDRLTLLSGKWVKITGNVAFPVMAQEPTEMLVMLNQWDGCCIGVPPTPYDAVEVKLSRAAEGKDRLVTYGTVTGKMTVEPYLVKDCLVSLYAMDDAAVARSE